MESREARRKEREKIIKNDFHQKLLSWYKAQHRNLPWRKTRNPYKIWISEVMLQQTTVQAVIPYYREWLKIFPDIKTLAYSPLEKVLRAWQGLGYYQRAKNLHKASKIIVNRYRAKIPQNYEALRELPGFGPYTTAALLSFAFGKRIPLLDANVRRVLLRLAGIQDEAHPKNDKSLLEFLTPYLPQKNVDLFNQGLMELGALICKVRNPLCLLCPITPFCIAYKKGLQEFIPRPRKRKYHKIEAVVAVVKNGQKYLVQKRPSSGLLADLWEFPGGKRQPGERLEDALRREIKEELGTEVSKEKFLIKVKHAYTQFQVTLFAFECSLKRKPELKRNVQRWVTLKALRQYPFVSGSAKIIDFLEKRKTDRK